MRKHASIILLVGCFTFSCSNNYDDSNPATIQLNEENHKSASELSSIENEKAEKLDFVLPSPLQIAAIFQKSGLEYKKSLTHKLGISSIYSTEFQQALNFGVYSADLNYCVLNKQNQVSIDYLSEVRYMSDQLGLIAIFEIEPLLESFERNIDNKDSIIYILSKLQRNLDLFLEENETSYKAIIYFTGAWIEGMYLGSNSVDLRNKEKISNRLVEQLPLLKNLIKGLENYPRQTSEFADLVFKLKNLKSAMQVISDNGTQNETGLTNYYMDDATLDHITNIVSDVRTHITKS